LALLVRTATITATPPEKETIESEAFISDIDDRPILRAAVKSDADILITGDNHFLKAGINKPRIVTCREFLDMVN
jgi:predicted nucleic acid-binding protein